MITNFSQYNTFMSLCFLQGLRDRGVLKEESVNSNKTAPDNKSLINQDSKKSMFPSELKEKNLEDCQNTKGNTPMMY